MSETHPYIRDRIKITGECWIWQLSKNSDGYGHAFFEGKPSKAHRLSYEMHKGPIPDGMNVCHRCDVRDCVNPGHLFLGSQADNIKDMHEKGRGVNLIGASHGRAKLSEDDVRNIRELRKTKTAKEVARIYGVTESAVQHIYKRRLWKHVI